MGVYVFEEGTVAFTPYEELVTDLDSAVRNGDPVAAVMTDELAKILALFSDLVDYVRPYASVDAKVDELVSRAEIRR